MKNADHASVDMETTASRRRKTRGSRFPAQPSREYFSVCLFISVSTKMATMSFQKETSFNLSQTFNCF